MQSGIGSVFRLLGQNCSMNVTSSARIGNFGGRWITVMHSFPRIRNQGEENQKHRVFYQEPPGLILKLHLVSQTDLSWMEVQILVPHYLHRDGKSVRWVYC